MTDEAPSPEERAARNRRLGGIAAVVVAVGVVVYILFSWSDPPDPGVTVSGPESDPPTLAAAIEKAKEITGHDESETTSRALVLLGWATRHLNWPQAEIATNQTSYEAVEKNVAAETGKRLCVSGKVTVIHLVKTDSARSAAGVLTTLEGKNYSFMAARSVGTVQEGHAARLCGVVTGWNKEASDLGPPRAPVIVGMFEADKENMVDQ